MMNFDTWKNGIISAIEIFADENAQKRIWVEGSTEISSSWEEAYCVLFDDLDVEGFIDTYGKAGSPQLSASICTSLERFIDAATAYDAPKFGGFANPEAVLSDTEWHRVCKYAEEALNDLRSTKR